MATVSGAVLGQDGDGVAACVVGGVVGGEEEGGGRAEDFPGRADRGGRGDREDVGLELGAVRGCQLLLWTRGEEVRHGDEGWMRQ